MKPPKVCILTAGRGTRMGGGFAWINKALLPLQDKAIISHIIEACPPGTEFVIGLGHLADQVRSYVSVAHPGLPVSYVEVDPWQGPGSGPGRSLLCCKPLLGERFAFVPCDFVPSGPIDTVRPGDWAGVAAADHKPSEQYCNLLVKNGAVLAVADKQRPDGPGYRVFTGLMRIEHAEIFWEGVKSAGAVAGECQVSGGLEALARAGGLDAVQHPWTDVGDSALYKREIIARHGYDFSKPGEALYILNDRVVKLFRDAIACSRRVSRGRAAAGVFPAMLDAGPGFLAYDFIEGNTLYDTIDADSLDALLGWCARNLWVPVRMDPGPFASLCDRFFRTKTLQRVEQYRVQGGFVAEPQDVMGQPVPPVAELLDAIDWDDLSSGGRPVRFHGDLQFDNVLVGSDGGFTLLDWRQDFAGEIEAGDLDYDLAKMLGGIRVNYALVKRGEFSYSVGLSGERHDARFRLPSCPQADKLEARLLGFAEESGRDPRRIRLLTGLIHLNMAPLHAEPFGAAMRDLARLEIAAELVPT